MSLHITRHDRIVDLPAPSWNRLVEGRATLGHAFIAALEAPGGATPAAGWRPCHLALWRGENLVGGLLRYEKDHSYGEFVFDWAWAEAFARAGVAYYPKLVTALPFTPVPGPRLIGVDATARAHLLGTALDDALASAASSWHVLFAQADDTEQLARQGLALRHGLQFHWHNAGYRDFADFLDTLSRDKRKKIRQERRRVAEAGVCLRRIPGRAATPADWALVRRCYEQTYAERGRRAYLGPAFFEALAAHAADSVLLVIAERAGETIAAAMNLVDDKRLYGRYWGSLTFVPGLHFETCYYQGIEHCIERRLAVFEGGAQGEHKLARGFLPVRTCSAHWLRDARFSAALREFLARESRAVAHYLDELDEHSPFRAAAGPG